MEKEIIVNEKSKQTLENASEASRQKQREAGFEILRIISILLIICVHVINFGGLLANSSHKLNTEMLRILWILFNPTINVFVLISGYFLVNSKFKPIKLLRLWGMMVFYNLFAFILYNSLNGSTIYFSKLLKCFMPLANDTYWFFTAYFVMYLASPLLNKILKNSSKKELTIVVFAIFLIAFLDNKITSIGIFSLNYGGSFLWFCMVYLVAGYIRLYPPKIKKLYLFLILIASYAAMFASYHTTGWIYQYVFYSNGYAAFFALTSAVCLLLFFKGIQIKHQKIASVINYFSASTFAIYILHSEGNAGGMNYILFKFLKVQNVYSSKFAFVYVLLFTTAIYLMCFAVDAVRREVTKLIEKGIQKRKQNQEPKPKEDV